MSKSKNLTLREIEVIILIAEGASSKEIAKQLYISEKTAKVHTNHIFEKLNVSSRIQAAVYAYRNKIVSL